MSVLSVALIVLHTFVSEIAWLLFPMLAVVMAAAGVWQARVVAADDATLVPLGLSLVNWVVCFPLYFFAFVLSVFRGVTLVAPTLEVSLLGYALGLATIGGVGCFVVGFTLTLAYQCGRSSLETGVQPG